MKKLYSVLSIFASVLIYSQTNVGITGNVAGVYINEIHYDNSGTDAGEFVEVVGPAGTDLSTYTISLYNGSSTSLKVYSTITLSGTIDDEGAGVGAVSFATAGIQNGAPDGVSLSNGGTNIQFISYEGSFTAADGPALGLTSADVIVIEDGLLTGTSLEYNEASMVWVVITDDTPGLFAQGPVLSTKNFNAIKGLSMYPNPVKDGNLYITSNSSEAKTVGVYDILGKQVLSAKTSNNAVNVSNLKGGAYIVRITEDGKTDTRKLIIE